MAKVSVDIPDKELDQLSKDKIASLEKDLKNALNRETKLKKKIAEQEGEFHKAKMIILAAKDFYEEIRWEIEY